MSERLTPEDIVYAYRMGYFPMAESREGDVYWHSPDPRAIIPLDKIKVPRSVRQSVRRNRFECKVDYDFTQVMRLCADRDETWISEEIIQAYSLLHRMGIAHSVETWQEGNLVGGLYGLAIGAAFFGESMFTKISDASKAAFYHLALRLRKRNYILLDSQYINTHTKNLGAVEIPKELYLIILQKALKIPCIFKD